MNRKKRAFLIEKYLYHATFAPLLKKIKVEGLGSPSSKPLWIDSKKGVVYLSRDKDVAISYAEAAIDSREDIPESWLEKIIVLVVDVSFLDEDKIYVDSNVIDNDGTTIEYHGIIPFEAIAGVSL